MKMPITKRAHECSRDLWDEMDRIDRESGEYGQAMQSYSAQEHEWRRLVEAILLKWFQPDIDMLGG